MSILGFSPGFHFLLGVLQGQEPVLVQEFLLNLPLNASMKTLSVGLPSRQKSTSTPFNWAHWSRNLEVNSGRFSPKWTSKPAIPTSINQDSPLWE